jgi:hypothetical protein
MLSNYDDFTLSGYSVQNSNHVSTPGKSIPTVTHQETPTISCECDLQNPMIIDHDSGHPDQIADQYSQTLLVLRTSSS